MTAPTVLRQYLVTWEIDMDDVANPVEAARAALDIQRDPNSVATVFTVHGESGSVTVDLEDKHPTHTARELSACEVTA